MLSNVQLYSLCVCVFWIALKLWKIRYELCMRMCLLVHIVSYSSSICISTKIPFISNAVSHLTQNQQQNSDDIKCLISRFRSVHVPDRCLVCFYFVEQYIRAGNRHKYTFLMSYDYDHEQAPCIFTHARGRREKYCRFVNCLLLLPIWFVHLNILLSFFTLFVSFQFVALVFSFSQLLHIALHFLLFILILLCLCMAYVRSRQTNRTENMNYIEILLCSSIFSREFYLFFFTFEIFLLNEWSSSMRLLNAVGISVLARSPITTRFPSLSPFLYQTT